MSNSLRRKILGASSLLLFGTCLVLYCTISATSRLNHTNESLFRLACILGVAWLAWDDLLRIPKWLYFLGPIIVIGISVFPRATPYFLLIFVPIWFFIRFLRFISQPLTPQQRSSNRKNLPKK